MALPEEQNISQAVEGQRTPDLITAPVQPDHTNEEFNERLNELRGQSYELDVSDAHSFDSVALAPLQTEDMLTLYSKLKESLDESNDPYGLLQLPAQKGQNKVNHAYDPQSGLLYKIQIPNPEDNDSFCGFVGLTQIDQVKLRANASTYIFNPEFRGKGLGPTLAGFRFRLAKQLGLKTVYAYVLQTNLPSVRYATKVYDTATPTDDGYIYFEKDLSKL